jgi:hypothetical protein
MNQAVVEMLDKYQIHTPHDAENALKEIIQEIALLGLHRANFLRRPLFTEERPFVSCTPYQDFPKTLILLFFNKMTLFP